MPLLLAVVLAALLALASMRVVRVAWRSTGVRPQLGAAALIGGAAGALAFAVAWRLDPGPSCSVLVAPGDLDDLDPRDLCPPGQRGWGVAGCLVVAGPVVVGTTVLAAYYLLLARAWHAGRRRQEGWPPCATS